MNQMIGPNRKCDLTCICSRRIRDYQTYGLFQQPKGWGKGVITICEHHVDQLSVHKDWLRIHPIVRLKVEDGTPVDPPPTKK